MCARLCSHCPRFVLKCAVADWQLTKSNVAFACMCFVGARIGHRSVPPTRWPSLTIVSGNCPEMASSTRQTLSFRATCRTWTHGVTCRLKTPLPGELFAACGAIHCVLCAVVCVRARACVCAYLRVRACAACVCALILSIASADRT